MPTWLPFRYGPQIHNKGLYWDSEEGVRVTGEQRPWLLYVGGGGWAGTDPVAFFDPQLGEGIFTGFINANTGGSEWTQLGAKPGQFSTVCFAPWVSEGFYNFRNVSHSGWTEPEGGGSGNWRYGEYLKGPLDGAPYRCIRAHHGETGRIPGGFSEVDVLNTGWSGYWELATFNDVGNKRFDHAAFSSRYRDSSARDVARCVQYIKTNSGRFGIDPENGILMGPSAGGQQVGTAAFDFSEPYSKISSKSAGDEWVYSFSSKPKGVILDITPDDWRNYDDMFGLMTNLFGVTQDQETWQAWPDSKKAGLGPLGVLTQTRQSIPTLLTNTSASITGSDLLIVNPPWTISAFHAAYAAFQTFDFLTGVLEQQGCEFWHADNVVDRESPRAERVRRQWNWATGLWVS